MAKLARPVDFTRAQARARLPRRDRYSHKAKAGRALVIAGSRAYRGAAVLSATAAARVGAGYVSLLGELGSFSVVRHPDFLVIGTGPSQLRRTKFSAVAIGPGLGVTVRTRRYLEELERLGVERVVVDADALTVKSREREPRPFPPTWISTPHEGELARLLGVTAEAIHADRARFARLGQRRLGGIVVLKGHHTLVATGTRLYRVRSGNGSLAKAGTGDVLTGLLVGLLAQGLASLDAARLGVYLHGFLADEWVRAGNDPLALMASDLVERLPRGLARLRKR